ncbi:MAG: 2-phospho-L-lactate guanylyltransferase [Anaerolineales bacterium]|nr:2-phospho-L-lactate guanylyltransferase [Anaerolineales bacterium]
MTIWAIVPVKPLRRGKTRLAKVLSEDQRAALNKRLLIHTLDTITQLPVLEQVLVVSRDPEALAIARYHGARTVLEDGAPHLNIAITRAATIAMIYNVSGVLILPADLPQLTESDVLTMAEAAKYSNTMVIAPDHRQQGTNALLVKPPNLINFSFGENSFYRHTSQATAKGARVAVVELPSLARDVDYPEDLVFLNGQLEAWTSVEDCNPRKGSNGNSYAEMIASGTVGSES